jgi:hypothetical protein
MNRITGIIDRNAGQPPRRARGEWFLRINSQFSAMSAKKDGHNSMNHGYEQDESKK